MCASVWVSVCVCVCVFTLKLERETENGKLDECFDVRMYPLAAFSLSSLVVVTGASFSSRGPMFYRTFKLISQIEMCMEVLID